MGALLQTSPAPWLSVKQAAAAYSVSELTVRRALAAGELKARRFGRLIRIDPDSLAAWGSAL